MEHRIFKPNHNIEMTYHNALTTYPNLKIKHVLTNYGIHLAVGVTVWYSEEVFSIDF